jgi:deoxyadenosine/deoxycytidine kinase
MGNSFFVEGLQGAGKSTLVNRLSEKYPNYKVFREGDYAPTELAWCAYVDENTYRKILTKYPTLQEEIKQNTTQEEERYVVTYTKILTDVAGFHRDLEQYEIYNGNLPEETFEKVILSRYEKWNGEQEIFECAIFQNIMENMMLYLRMEDEEILEFYRRLHNVVGKKKLTIMYLDVEDIRTSIEVIKKERSDVNGVELWFPLMVKYVEASPYGHKHGLLGMEGLITHLERRKVLEHRIISEVFSKETQILMSKKYII